MWSEGGVERRPKGDGVAKKTLQGQICSDESIRLCQHRSLGFI